MLDVLRDKPRRTAGVLLLITLIGAIYLSVILSMTLDQNNGNLGAVLDDTWIHVRFADSISQGEGLSYNEGTVTTGATSPLWVLLLAGAYRITGPDIYQQVDLAIGMSAIGFFMAAWAITGLGWWATRNVWIGLGAGLITVLTGRFLWMGLAGMEITTFTTLTILALWSHAYDVRERLALGWRTGILAALATLARPEAYLLMILIGLDSFVVQTWRDFDTREARLQHVLQCWRGCAAYVILAGSYPLTSLLISGHPLPNTFRVKSALGREFPDLPHAYLWAPNNEHGPILIALAAIGLFYMLWKSREKQSPHLLWASWATLFVLGVLMLGSQRFVVNNSRYVAPAIPFHALLAMTGIWAGYEWLTTRFTSGVLKYAPHITSAVLIVLVLLRGYDNASGIPNNVKQLRQMHLGVAEWVIENTNDDALIALNDVGAIVHVSDRKVLDLEGLVSEDVIEATKGTEDYTCEHDLQLARLMLQQKPSVVAVFPWFYPCLTSWDGALQPQTVYSITGSTVIAGGEMIVYRPQWENWPVLDSIEDGATEVDANFENRIKLTAYDTEWVDQGLLVTLWWDVGQDIDENYHVFVHLYDANGEFIAQHDSRPQNNQFETGWWRDGDIVKDRHLIELEDATDREQDRLQVRIGLYRFDDLTRLQRTDENAGFPDMIQLPVVLELGIIG
jgi:4-amino-4-deoxy-L-arabinose transferase-like glycosyltransferase